MDIINIISIVLVTTILVAIIWVLIHKNKRLRIRIRDERKRFLLFEVKLEELQKEEPSKKELEALNNLAREFFNIRFELKYSFTYLELAKIFKEQKKEEHRKFCKLMSDLIYREEKINPSEIKKALDSFDLILKKDNKIFN